MYTQNLVPNGGFENYQECPNEFNIDLIPLPCLGPVSNSVDFFHSCAINFQSVPGVFSMAHYQYAHSGEAYIGVFTLNGFGGNYKEYIEVQLTETLFLDNCYYVEFYINPMNYMNFGSNNMGLHFSQNEIVTTNTGLVLDLEPQVLKKGNPVITDTLNWTKIAGVYQSNGTENFITIGNFETDENTDTIVKYVGGYGGAYYLIDDISVIAVSDLPNSMPAFAGNDTMVAPGDSIFIGQEISNLNCTWRKLDGTFWADSISGIYVQPTEETTYVVEQNLCGTITYDTVVVSVGYVGLNPLQASSASASSVVISPNPNNGSFEIQNLTKQELNFELTNALGQVVFQEKIFGENQKIEVQLEKGDALSLSKGIYFASFSNGTERFEEKIVVY